MSEPQNPQAFNEITSRRKFIATAGVAAGAAAWRPLSGSPALASATERTPIPTRPLGRTGVDISLVGVGCGSRFYDPIPDAEAAAELLRTAIERGITFLETGANYGPDGRSEIYVGAAMKTHRARVFLETKVDARDYDGAMREIERSMERMHTDRLDLVLHHILSDVDQVRGPRGAEPAIRKLVDQGVVRFRGFSTHTPEVALSGMERLEPDAIQLPINAVRVPDFEPQVLPAAAARGVGVIAMKTCGHSYFHPAHATVPDRIERYGPPPGAWDRWDLPTYTDYIHYALSLPIATATIGIDSFFTLDGVIAAATSFEPLSLQRMAWTRDRAAVFRTTGYWVPRG